MRITRTWSPKKADVTHDWWIIDAKGQTLGRVATEAATLLKGKHKPTYATHVDMGDYVIIINAADIAVTGGKPEQILYKRYSGYPDGLTQTKFNDQIKRKPTLPVEHAVKGMLPHNALGRQMFRKLRVFAGETHPHVAQKPKEYALKYVTQTEPITSGGKGQSK